MAIAAFPFGQDGGHVRFHHVAHQCVKAGLVTPAELGSRFAGVSEERIHLCRPEITWVDLHQRRPGRLVEALLLDASPAPDDQLLALNDALDRFTGLEPQQAELVKLRYFVGLKTEEAAEVLGVSRATANRWWAYARAWLFHETRADSSGIRTTGKA